MRYVCLGQQVDMKFNSTAMVNAYTLCMIRCTDQASAPAAEAGVLQPGPHVLVGADDERSDHQDPLPVLNDALTTLEENT